MLEFFSINTYKEKKGENKLEEIFERVFEPYRGKFSEFGVSKIEYQQFPQESLPYITQYDETDLHFLLRLCGDLRNMLYPRSRCASF